MAVGTAPGAPLSLGMSGVVVAVNTNTSTPTPVGGTFDGLNAWAVPEPTTLTLLALGGIAALVRRRRR